MDEDEVPVVGGSLAKLVTVDLLAPALTSEPDDAVVLTPSVSAAAPPAAPTRSVGITPPMLFRRRAFFFIRALIGGGGIGVRVPLACSATRAELPDEPPLPEDAFSPARFSVGITGAGAGPAAAAGAAVAVVIRGVVGLVCIRRIISCTLRSSFFSFPTSRSRSSSMPRRFLIVFRWSLFVVSRWDRLFSFAVSDFTRSCIFLSTSARRFSSASAFRDFSSTFSFVSRKVASCASSFSL
mmetsp:Transcript_17663/g.44081  ORF Transcript_17663/g.44081 Transcript_17663/m.44081 type:complete len:239 (-) Transcript_17663:3088-3804(-)